MRLPGSWLTHQLTAEPYLGEAGAGPLYGPAVSVPCHLEPMRESQRRSPDRAPRDATRAIAPLRFADVLALDSRITVDGRRVEVLTRAVRTYPGTPEHVELTFA